MIVWERGQRLKINKHTCRIQRVCSPKTPQMPALSKISDNAQSERGPTDSKPCCSWIHPLLGFSSWNSVVKRRKWGGNPFCRQMYTYSVPRSTAWSQTGRASRFGAQPSIIDVASEMNWADSAGPNSESPCSCILRGSWRNRAQALVTIYQWSGRTDSNVERSSHRNDISVIRRLCWPVT